MNEYLHILKTKDIQLEEFLCIYECYYNRSQEEMDSKIKDYSRIGTLYFETREES